MTDISWSLLYEKREETHRRWPVLWGIPLLRKRFDLVASLISDGAKVLDVGAGSREWGPRLQKRFPNLTYKSVDIDPHGNHDYHDIKEVEIRDPREGFDLVLWIEVIEHLPPEKGLELLREIHRVLKPGGRLLVTTPNTFHPAQYRDDCTHVTPYSYENLGGVLLMSGFELESLHRAWNASFLKRIVRFFARPLHRLLCIDYAKTLIAVARKPE